MPFRTSKRMFPLYQLFVLVLFSVSFLVGCGATGEQAADKVVVAAPQTDHRDYRYVELPNGLRAIIVSDPDAKKSAASLDVHVGSSADPEQRQGLAHFLEHMLFLGTQKYPDAGEYQQYITAHGGSHNAYTAFEHTNYFFDIDAGQLEGALDRFSQFFVAPLFTAQYVDREKNAVDSEYRANYKDEYRRAADVLREVVNQQHPFHKFSVGSLDTLADRDGSAIRDDLLKFYERYYSANIMTLAVIGREPADVLEQWVREKFSAVPNHKRKPLEFTQPFLTADSLPAQLNIVPEKEVRQLSLTFPIPDVLPYQREKPTSYIAYLLGHEGNGSLLSYLKGQGWADALSAGEGISYRGGSTLDITITLTKSGVDNYDAVVSAIFQAIKRVAQQGVDAWRYEEQAALADLDFRYQDAQQPMHDAMRISGSLQYYAPEDALRGAYLMTKFDAALIRKYLAALTPDNALVTLVAPGLATDRASRFYQTPYSIKPIPQPQLARWRDVAFNDAIALPVKNPFVPQQMSVAKISTPATAVPAVLKDAGGLHLRYLQDDSFALPKTSNFFSVRSPVAQSDAQHAALLEWYVRVLRDDLNELGYPAQLAGLDFRIDAHARGFSVRMSGYDDKQPVLLGAIIESLKKRSFDQVRVAAYRNDLVRRWRNADAEPPYQVLMRRVRQLLYLPSYTEKELADALEPLDSAALTQFVEQFWQAVDIDALVVGNADEATARAFGDQLSSSLIQQTAQLPPVGVAKLSSSSAAWHDARLGHADTAVVWYLQGEDDSPRTKALLSLSAQLMEAQFYQSLRTEQQFGYVVYAGYMPMLDVPGMAFVVQSPRYKARDIEKAVLAFWQQFAAASAQLPATMYAQHRDALINQLLQPPKNLNEKAEDFWMSIALGDIDFNRRQAVADALGTISLQDWQRYMRDALSSTARHDVLLIAGNGDKPKLDKSVRHINDLQKFKKEAPRYSYP